jgi:uncharacterized membrane protein YGL010W
MISPFRPALELLGQYAEYHRDRRNIVTHFVGIPLIVFAIGILLARPGVRVAGHLLTPAWLLWVVSSAWYLSRGEPVLGAVVSLANALLLTAAQTLSALGTAAWLACGLGTLIVGAAVQVIGHYYEGRKPACLDDHIGLLVGPMFVAAQALFTLGWNHELLRAIEHRAGPVVLHDLAARA